MREFLKFIFPYMKEQKYIFILANIFVIIAAIVQTSIPLQIAFIIDEILPLETPQLLINGFLILFTFAIMELVLNFSMRLMSVQFSRRIMYNIRRNIFELIQDQELEFHSRETVGQIMARTIEEVYSLQEILTWGWRISILISWLFIGAFIAMWYSSPLLSISI